MQIAKELTTVVDILIGVSCWAASSGSQDKSAKAFTWFMTILLAVNIFLMWI